MSTTPTYVALTIDKRLALEWRLFERLTGSLYTERSIPDDASDKKKEYLVSCIRDACHRLQSREIAIVTAELFEQTMGNVAFTVKEIEQALA